MTCIKSQSCEAGNQTSLWHLADCLTSAQSTTCWTKETTWRGSSQTSGFIPSVLVDARRLTEADGFQKKMTLANGFLLNDSLVIKNEGRAWEWKLPESLWCPERCLSLRPCWPGCVVSLSRSMPLKLSTSQRAHSGACCCPGFLDLHVALMYLSGLGVGVIPMEKIRKFRERDVFFPFSCSIFTSDFTKYSPSGVRSVYPS